MSLLRALPLSIVLFLTAIAAAFSQAACPPNIDFEFGNLQNWSCYTSTNNGNGNYIWTSVAPISGRHTIVSGSGTDPYGNFPIVAPGGGTYSLKLGNNSTGSQMEQVRYTFTVPANQNEYAVIYRYAIVLEDPGHSAIEQPFFKVRAYNTATGATVNCGNFNYVSSSSLPGFTYFNRNGSVGYYKNWATASLNLSGQAGSSITLEFTTSDCSQSGHFGYAYVDMNCGVFSIQNQACVNAPTAPLSAPPGFQSYTWYDSSYANVLGSGQTINVPNPTRRTVYRVKLVPYPGYGCTDTLSSYIIPAALQVDAGRDTALCNQSSVALSPTVSGTAPPFTYAWSPAASLSCTSCTAPIATPTIVTSYVLTITDANNCTARDTIVVTPTAGIATASVTPVSCFGGADGSISVTLQNGVGPLTYQWNNTQSNTAISGLTAGTYTLTITDARGCVSQPTVVVPQPATPLSATISASQNVLCQGGNNGSATVTATGGTAPYTYSWNTTPVQTTATALGLTAGSYTATVTDNKGCVKNATVVITAPNALNVSALGNNIPCSGGNNGSAAATATGGTAPYNYSWNTTPIQTTATIGNLAPGNYTVTVTDANNCTQTASAVIAQSTALTLAIAKTDVTCNGAGNGTATVTATSGTAPYIYSWNTTPAQTTATAFNLAAGTYSVTVTDIHNCTQTVSTTLTQPAALTASITKTNVACNGGNNGAATITVGGGSPPYAYSWNTTPIQTTATASNLPAGNYTVIITDANNCIQTASAVIAQPAALTLATAKTDVACNGSSNGTASAIATGGVAPYLYSWNTTPVQTAATLSGLPVGSYTATVTDGNGCVKTASVSITAPTALALAIAKADVSCNGGSNGIATVTASGGTAPYAYSWNTTPTRATATAANLPAGSYAATVTDAKGCTATLPVTIGQPAALIATTSQTSVLCNGGSNGTATVAAAGGTPPYAYSWNTASPQMTATIANLSAGTYTATVTDSKGCQAIATASVAQPGTLSVRIISSNPKCYGDANGTATASVAGGVPSYTYRWNTTPVNTTATAGNLGAGTYTLTVADANNCVQTATVALTQPDSLTVAVSTSATHCYNSNDGRVAAIAGGGTTPYNFIWDNNAALTAAAYNNFAAGVHTVLVTDFAGCRKTASALIASPPALLASLAIDSIPCFGAATGQMSLSPVRGGAPPYQYRWLDGSGSTAASRQGLRAGTYTVRITDSTGCITDLTQALPERPALNVSAGRDASICNGRSTQLQAAGSAIRWQWSPVDNLSCAACADPVATPPQTTTYRLLATDAYSCTAQDSVTVTVQLHQPVAVGQEALRCAGDSVTLLASGGDRYQWSPAQSLQNPQTATPVAAPTETTNYQVAIWQGDCFVDTLYQRVHITPLPQIHAGNDVKLSAGAQMTLRATGSKDIKTVLWKPTVGLNCYDCMTPTIIDARSTTYTVTATTEQGCQSTDTIRVLVACDGSPFFVANTFTPNGDGMDDRFYPQGSGIVKINRMVIQSKWGEVVFERSHFPSNDPAFGWDGSFGGKPMDSGTFLYIIEAICDSGKQLLLKGDINLIR